ncbi:MAG: hypothetical protein QX197_06090 [Methylococcaceae bacterium]|jgi:hypothetical protein
MNIHPKNLPRAQHYIQRQFNSHSWWPKEQPEQAKHEFNLMQADSTALNVWCEKWLDAGQRQKLNNAITD